MPPVPAAFDTIRRYSRIAGAKLRISATTAMQYRFDFVLKGVLALFWLGISLVPLLVVFRQRPTLAGWTFPESLIVLGCFALLKAILDGGVSPSLSAVVEGIRTGAFDFVLLKPADAQFLVSTARFEPWRALDALGGLGIIAYGFSRLGRWPSLFQIGSALVLLTMAVVLLYSFWILVVCASFWAVRVDNLSFLFTSLFDVGRWPIDVFRARALRLLFTVIFPVALMTTVPAQALLGRLGPSDLARAFVGALVFAGVSRLAWLRSLSAYASASS